MTPAALNREQAAEYVGLSAGSFDKLVRSGEMPKGRRYRNVERIVWLVAELDAFLARVPVDGEAAAEAPEEVEL